MIHKVALDLRSVQWSTVLKSHTSGGCLLKYYDEKEDTYYKLSTFDTTAGFYGSESIYESLCSDLAGLFDIPHVEYSLFKADVVISGKEYTTYVCSSKSYLPIDATRTSLETFYELNRKDDETVLDLCDRYGWGSYARQILLFDYLTNQRDRHGANLEVYHDYNYHLAPIYDNGLSFVAPAMSNLERVSAYDPSKDLVVQCYLTGKYLNESLEKYVLPNSVPINMVEDFDILNVLEPYRNIFSLEEFQKIQDTIILRYNNYKQQLLYKEADENVNDSFEDAIR